MRSSPASAVTIARPRRRLPDAEVVALVGVLAVLVLLVVVPVALLVWRSFTPAGSVSLDAYRVAFAGVSLLSLTVTTVAFAVGASLLGLVLGTALAVALVGTDLPGRRVVLVLAVSPLLLPGVLQTIAWIFLAAPQSGALSGIPGVPSIFGLGGMIFVEGIRLAPLALLLVGAALRAGDPALEEAALIAGAGRISVLRRVTLPLLRPALAATGVLLAIRALGSFEVPALLGIPDRTWVFTSRVWLSLGEGDEGISRAAAASVPLLCLTALGSLALLALLRRPRAREVVSGRGYRRTPIELRRWRVPVLVGVWAYVVVAVVLPLLALVWMSTQPYLTPVTRDSLARAGLDSYSAVFDDVLVGTALRNSIVDSSIAALLACGLAAVIGWIALRGRTRGRALPDALAFLPIAIPGLVLGVALLGVFVRAPIALYGTAAALVLGYLARYLPYSSRFAGGGLARVGRELEDAARVSGVGWWPTLSRIVLPLAFASLAAAWLAVFAVALTDVSLSLVLYAPGSEVLGVRIWSLYQGGEWNELAALGVVISAVTVALGLAALALGRTTVRGFRALG
jgi:iron(III) transport system permease protein